MSNIPKLRFPEFKGEWEEKKLGECLTLLYGKDWKDKSSTKKLYPVLGTGGVISYIDEFIYDKPCVLIGRKGSINNPVFIDKPFWTVDTQFYSKIHEGYSPKFLYYIFCTENWSKHDESTGVPSLSAKNVENTHKHIPSYSEQQKIADFLSNVDSIITAETKILKTLQKKKKALMQKLFTQQLRFKSNDGTDFPKWEEKKLGDVCEISAGGDIDKENSQKIYSEQYPYAVYSNSLENKGLYGYANYFKIDGNTITVTGRGDVGHAIARHEKYVPIVRLLVCKPINNENVDFLENAINNTKIFIESTGVPQLTAPQLSNIFIKLPCIEEQEKIADCLSIIDSLIQTQQKVVTTWQQRKKALLQQMFI